jgi:hypothetical protein
MLVDIILTLEESNTDVRVSNLLMPSEGKM